MKSAALIVIYNHNFEKNISKIKHIYSTRFSRIIQIMPFYQGNDPDVIGVYDAAWQFNGYITQALPRLLQEKDISHYVVIADDIILHPELNEFNICQKLGIDEETAYIRDNYLINEEMMYSLDWAFYSYSRMMAPGTSCEFKSFIPSIEEARQHCARHGFDWSQGAPDSIIKSYLVQKKASHEFLGEMLPSDTQGIRAMLRKHIALGLTMAECVLKKPFCGLSDTIFLDTMKKYARFFAKSTKKSEPLYPLFWAYSDVMILPVKKIEAFAHLCGVFSAMRLFVEVALPTALVFTMDKIKTDKDIPYRGIPIWGAERLTGLHDEHNGSLAHLISNWPDDVLFYHPIKLSKWRLDI